MLMSLQKIKMIIALAKEGEIYAIYLPEGKATDILLPEGEYTINWFNPRTGGDLRSGKISKIMGARFASTGTPPGIDGKDWVCLIKRE